MGTRNYAECQVKQVPSAFNLQHSHGVTRQCHRLPRHKQRAAQPGLHTQGCTPGPTRPLLNSQASKALTTAQPARPLPNTQTSKASSKLPDQQGLPLNSQASKAPTTAQPARPLKNHPALHPQERGSPLRIQGQQGDVMALPGGQRARQQGNRETPGPSCSLVP